MKRHMVTMIAAGVVGLGVLASCPPVFATQPPGQDGAPSTRPSEGERRGPSRQGDRGMERPGGEGRPGDRRPGMVMPSPEEMGQIREFARQYMPAFYESWEAQNDRSRKLRMSFYAAGKFRMIQSARQYNPDVVEGLLRQVELEDAVFSLYKEWEAAVPEHKEQVYDRLIERFREVVENNLRQRERRLAELRASIEREEEALRRDQQNIEKVAERRLEQFIREMSGIRNEPGREGEGERKPPATQPGGN